jgi:hypothetical protein
MVKVRLVLPFSGIVAAPNDFEMEGGAIVWALIMRGNHREDKSNAGKRRITILLQT